MRILERLDREKTQQTPSTLAKIWNVSEDTAVTRAEKLVEIGAVSGESDHGAAKSVYGIDPDGHEFEIMWMVPREQWGAYESQAPSQPLDIERELQRFGKHRV